MNGDALAASLTISAFVLVVVVVFLIIAKNPPPCDGGQTGVQTYEGHVIECFHGHVVEVRRA